MLELGVNIDHVATLLNVRRAVEPAPVAAATERCPVGKWPTENEA